MKRTLFTLVTLVLILNSFSVLGVLFVDHSVHQTCPFAVLSSNDCETVADASKSLFHHISAFQTLTEVVLSSGASVLVLLLFAAVYISTGRLFSPSSSVDQVMERLGIQARLFVHIPNTILRWISLHNKRNTHLYSWRMVA
jgi:hypothetical protein